MYADARRKSKLYRFRKLQNRTRGPTVDETIFLTELRKGEQFITYAYSVHINYNLSLFYQHDVYTIV